MKDDDVTVTVPEVKTMAPPSPLPVVINPFCRVRFSMVREDPPTLKILSRLCASIMVFAAVPPPVVLAPMIIFFDIVILC